ncbi:MAG TPA: hypothetical protein C5S50_10925 [Methanosarcinaceae archaeon]|nr:hypothetical protein [Methanosarcinaceae archaeon]
MSNVIKRHTEIFVLAVILLTGFCQVGLAAECSMSITPTTITASQGDIFTIDVVADPAGSEVFGVECTVNFDNTMLKATEQAIGTFLTHDGADTIEVLNNINNDIGKVEYGEIRIGDPEVIGSVTDSGVISSIKFEVIGSGTCDLELEAMLANSGAQSIDVVVNSATCSVEGTDEPSTAGERTGGRTTPTAPEGQTQENNGLPGFGIVCSFIGLIAATLLVFRKELK